MLILRLIKDFLLLLSTDVVLQRETKCGHKAQEWQWPLLCGDCVLALHLTSIPPSPHLCLWSITWAMLANWEITIERTDSGLAGAPLWETLWLTLTTLRKQSEHMLCCWLTLSFKFLFSDTWHSINVGKNKKSHPLFSHDTEERFYLSSISLKWPSWDHSALFKES